MHESNALSTENLQALHEAAGVSAATLIKELDALTCKMDRFTQADVIGISESFGGHEAAYILNRLLVGKEQDRDPCVMLAGGMWYIRQANVREGLVHYRRAVESVFSARSLDTPHSLRALVSLCSLQLAVNLPGNQEISFRSFQKCLSQHLCRSHADALEVYRLAPARSRRLLAGWGLTAFQLVVKGPELLERAGAQIAARRCPAESYLDILGDLSVPELSQASALLTAPATRWPAMQLVKEGILLEQTARQVRREVPQLEVLMAP